MLGIMPGLELPNKDTISSLPQDGGNEFNRLIFEKSPYLLQHARNPVAWYPWSQEAFAEAKKQNKPIFLSVGYSTCHWCHVMEHESFEDHEVAALLNDAFICIKVDREERPDIDQVYMTVTQAITGQGGWPMTVMMTPEKKPFMAATYIPKDSRHGRAGMLELVPAINKLWQEDPQRILDSSENITDAISNIADANKGPRLSADIFKKTKALLASQFDSKKGGFASAPKFPSPHLLSLLMRIDSQDRMAFRTLDEMRLGGIYDHIGYGFHRYSTDEDWLLPHFEKMLYDQAMHVIAYTEAYQVSSNKKYLEISDEVISYVLRDLESPDGGFYSAEDADSEGVEGKFYVWSYEELKDILAEDDFNWFINTFNIKEDGNFLEEATREETGLNIPHLNKALDQSQNTRLEAIRIKLFDIRKKRIHPYKDDKILTDWNGLMIAAIAKAARCSEHSQRYIDSAKKAADFVLDKLKDKDGRLLKRYRDGEAAMNGHLNDYAFMVWALLELYETCFDIKYLKEAIELNDKLIKHFWDKENGGLFMTADYSEELLIRAKDNFDGAIPSGNSIAALCFAKLAKITADNKYNDLAWQIIEAFSNQILSYPSGFAQMLIALDLLLANSKEIVIVGELADPKTQEALEQLNQNFDPHKIILLKSKASEEELSHIAPYTKEQKQIDGQTTFYVCENYSCKEPSTKLDNKIINP